VDGATVYLGGAFTTVGGVARNRVAAVGTNGTLAAWNPNVNSTVTALKTHTGAMTIYVGGSFTTVGLDARASYAQLGDFTNPVPSISGLSPNSRRVGSPGTVVTVSGSNFVPASVVRCNGTDRATVFVSSGVLTVTLTSGDFASVGSLSVTVRNPTPGGGESSLVNFQVGYAQLKVVLSGLPTAPVQSGVIARRIYRTSAGGSEFHLVGEIRDNVTTTFGDTMADAVAVTRTAVPEENQTGLVPKFIHEIPIGPESNVSRSVSLPLGASNTGYYLIRSGNSGAIMVGACYGENDAAIYASN